MRLLAEAEQMAGTGWRALVHVAAVLAQADPAHAARVLDDAVHSRSGYPDTRQILDTHQILEAVGDIGRVVARMDAQPAGRLLAELEARMGKYLLAAEDENFQRIRLAGLIASVDSDWAERVAHAALDAVTRAAALNAASCVVAQSDITRAEQIARTISDSVRLQTLGRQLKKTIPVPRGKRRPASSWNGRQRPSFSPGFYEASALAHIAVTAAGSMDALAMPPSSVAAQLVPTISGTQAGGRAPARSGDAQRLLTEAERVASGLPEAGDDRAHALSEVQLAAVRVRPDGQSRFLAEAENHARAIADGQRRIAALGLVARVAARIDPLRAAQISDALHPVQRYPVAILIASLDPVQAIRLLAQLETSTWRPLKKRLQRPEPSVPAFCGHYMTQRLRLTTPSSSSKGSCSPYSSIPTGPSRLSGPFAPTSGRDGSREESSAST